MSRKHWAYIGEIQCYGIFPILEHSIAQKKFFSSLYAFLKIAENTHNINQFSVKASNLIGEKYLSTFPKYISSQILLLSRDPADRCCGVSGPLDYNATWWQDVLLNSSSSQDVSEEERRALEYFDREGILVLPWYEYRT